MKVVTVLGTRPEIIRLSRVIPKLDLQFDQVLVHTGQNYDPELSDVFFNELGVRSPDHYLGARGSTSQQVGTILVGVESLLATESPDRFLVLGDTNSALSAYAAKRAGVPVYHMEAGNRCYDDRVPEEVNRRVVDHCSDILLPYTERSRQNLLREGVAGDRIFVTGNPIREVMLHYEDQISDSRVLNEQDLESGEFFLVTIHRSENVDVPENLKRIVDALELIQNEFRRNVIVSTHPHTRQRINELGLDQRDSSLRFLPPFGFFDYLSLEMNACCVLTDSGTVQEECSILGKPVITVREATERPETIESGGNVLSGLEPQSILESVSIALSSIDTWSPPQEYLVENVSDRVAGILKSYLRPRD